LCLGLIAVVYIAGGFGKLGMAMVNSQINEMQILEALLEIARFEVK
jgi:hypothetical protein